MYDASLQKFTLATGIMKYGPTSPKVAVVQNAEPNKTFIQDNAVTVTTYNMGEPCQSLKGIRLRKPKLRKLKEKVKTREESADSEGSRGQGLVDNATLTSHK